MMPQRIRQILSLRPFRQGAKQLLFTHVSPLIKQGREQPLEADHIPQLPVSHELRRAFQQFHRLAPIVPSENGKVTTRQVLRFIADIAWRARRLVLRMVLLSIALVFADLMGPICVHHLLSLLSAPDHSQTWLMQGFLAAVALGLTGAVSGILGQHYIYKLLHVGQHINAGLGHCIYETTLRLSRCARQKYPTGDLVNLIGSDTDAVQDVTFALNEIVMTVLQVAGAAALMTHYLGSAGLTAVIILILLVPPTKWIARKFVLHGDAVAAERDRRVAYMTQSLTAIRIVKSFGWEDLVSKKVGSFRDKELSNRYKFIQTAGFSVVLYRSIGMIVGGAVLATMVATGEPLNAVKLFTAVALIGVMEGPFGHLTDFISMFASAMVSAERIGKFLGSPQLQPRPLPNATQSAAVGLVFDGLSCSYANSKHSVLRDINLRISPGSAVAIVGSVASGKSSFLSAILGELRSERGLIQFVNNESEAIQPSIAYVPQEAFIQNASLRDNILFGALPTSVTRDRSYGSDLQTAIFSACLESDIKNFTGGLNTEIGEHGVNLSGGQKQRVALARAVIQDPDLVLLDDPLSALDHKTEDLVVERLLFDTWRDRTRLVVTHRLKHLERFDQVIFLENGQITASGTFDSLLQKCPRFAAFYNEHTLDNDATEHHSAAINHKSSEQDQSDARQNHSTTETIKIIESEDRRYGAVQKQSYMMYLQSMWHPSRGSKARSWHVIMIFALAMLATTLMPLILNAWMGAWGDQLQTAAPSFAQPHSSLLTSWVSPHPKTNIGMYLVLALMGVAIAWGQYVLYGQGGVKAGQHLHDAMLQAVLHAKIRFFDATPMGRILNRFAKDLDTVERNLPWSFEQTIRCGFQLIGTLGLITFMLPWTLFLTIPVLWVYYRLQHDYRMSSRETQRLNSITRSPRYSQFKETIVGLPVIRAFGREDHLRQEFVRHMEHNMRMFHGMVLLNRWFSIRVALTASLITIGVGIGAVWSAGHGYLLAGTAGLLVTYGMRFWETLNWTVRSFSQLETQMTSVERLVRYAEIPCEEGYHQDCVIASDRDKKIFQPATSGTGLSIEFDQVKMRYDEHLPLILKGVSFRVKAGQRVGIVGKTGAGKSSIFHALFRFSPLSSGAIRIGGVPTTHIPLKTLRSLISIVPQDPTLFMGTFRSNLDPFDQCTDAEIWAALNRVAMDERIRGLKLNLNAEITENGLNLSQGERQLICLARALLSDAPIIVMDEATSGIDVETDARIQATIRREFVGRTILMIAHRLATVADCDQLIELTDGKVSSVTKRKECTKPPRRVREMELVPS